MDNNYSRFTQNVLTIVKAIPAGETMSYGEVARMAGNPRAARQVVRILSTLSDKYQLPWHRVVNRNGRISLPGTAGELQKSLLALEGVHAELER